MSAFYLISINYYLAQYLVESYVNNVSYNDRLLSEFYNGFDAKLTGIFTFIGTQNSGGNNNQINNLSLYGSATDESECVEIHDITNSYLATCILWTRCNETYGKSNLRYQCTMH